MGKAGLQQVWEPSARSTAPSACPRVSRFLTRLKSFQGGSHRASIYEDWDPFRFRHMIPLEALQVRALASAGKVPSAGMCQGCRGAWGPSLTLENCRLQFKLKVDMSSACFSLQMQRPILCVRLCMSNLSLRAGQKGHFTCAVGKCVPVCHGSCLSASLLACAFPSRQSGNSQ